MAEPTKAEKECGWTAATLRILMDEREKHAKEIRTLEDKLNAERDRRYAEVNIEKEKALRIKEDADKTALGLAREIQVYKDEKANELREQINRERGLYATKDDLKSMTDKFEAVIAPLLAFSSSSQGRSGGLTMGWGIFLAVAGLLFAGVAAVAAAITVVISMKH